MNRNPLNKILFALLFVSFTYNIHARKNSPKISGSLGRVTDTLAGYAASAISEVPFWAPSLFTQVPEALMFKISEIKAKRVFWDAYDSVPAYRDFVNKHSNGIINCFSDIPLTSKADYIKKYPIEKTLKGGKIPTEGYMDPSSGTSGRRTLWIRGKDEIKVAQKTMNLVRNMFLGNEDYVLINMFLPSAWYLGLMRGLGPNVTEAYETLKDLGTKPKYLIMGHTSLMKYFAQNAPMDLTQYDITFLIGGEHMSRALHADLLKRGIKKVIAGYGASDIHFTVGIQEDFAQKLQELCWSDPELKKDLTGSENGLPYFFQYSPLQDYVEEIDGRLIFTDLDHTRISPRVRYDIGDKGKVLKMSFVQKVLKQHGIDLTSPINLPLICLYGRADLTVMFHDAELAFDDLELAALAVSEIGKHMNQYAYNSFKDEKGISHLEFWIELKPGFSATLLDKTIVGNKLLTALGQINPVFKKELERKGASNLAIRIYEHGMSPMLEESIFRKAKYVYNLAKS